MKKFPEDKEQEIKNIRDTLEACLGLGFGITEMVSEIRRLVPSKSLADVFSIVANELKSMRKHGNAQVTDLINTWNSKNPGKKINLAN